jgi:predicted PurR-regulated permease PerM
LAFFAALINVIPYLGPLIGAAFGIIITISSNLDLDFYTQMLPLLSKVVIVFAGMQMLDNFLLQPWIFSNSVLAHPLEIFIVILMGAQINGIIGMVLAIPVYTVLRVIARSFLSEFKIVQKITGGLNET